MDFKKSLPPALVLCVALGACAPVLFAPKPVQPASMTQGGIVLSLAIKGRDFPYFLTHSARAVSFAQIGPNGKPDMDHLVSARYYFKPYVYALNLPPGRYVPIAALYPFFGARDVVVFSRDDVKDWPVQVKPGEISFMGENTI